MKLNTVLKMFSMAAIGFFIGISFPVQITPKVSLWSFGDQNLIFGGRNILDILSMPFRNNISAVDGTLLQSNATSEVQLGTI